MFKFTVGRVEIRIGLGSLMVVAPIAGKHVQLDVSQVVGTAKNKLTLKVDGQTQLQLEVQVGNDIPF